MKCAFHPNQDATGQCTDCGRMLCHSCTNKYQPVLCEHCADVRERTEIDKFIITFIISVVLFIWAIKNENSSSYNLDLLLTYAFLVAGLPFGWLTLNKFKFDAFVVMPFIGWIIYIIIKLVLSALVGGFAMIFQIFIFTPRIILYNRAHRIINSNENQQYNYNDEHKDVNDKIKFF